jgi:hypothetical protein
MLSDITKNKKGFIGTLKKRISNLVHTTRFLNNFHHNQKVGKPDNLKVVI